MSFFDKLFSDKNKVKENSELKKAYDSLSDESSFNPEKILDENSDVNSKDTPEGYPQENDAAFLNDGAFDVFKDSMAEDEPYGSAPEHGGDLEDYESGFENTELSDDYTDELDTDVVYDDAQDGGSTGEMDAGEIERAAGRTHDYVSESRSRRLEDSLLAYGEEYSPEDVQTADAAAGGTEDEPSVSEEAEAPAGEDEINDTFDKELVYAAYAPRSIRSEVTEKSYYDLDDIEEEDEPEQPGKFRAFLKKRRWFIVGACAAVVVIAALVGTIIAFRYPFDPLMGYSEVYAVKGNIIKTMSAAGNVEPNATYNITPLVSGAVTESPLNAGEAVRAGELVYKIDDTNAQLAVQQAENAVRRSQTASSSSSSTTDLRIYANATGVISDLNISAGSTINGGKIATITQAGGAEIALIPSVTGTVQSVSVRNGANVTAGQVIATLRSDASGTSENRELDRESAELALEQAQKELEKYRIASPIDGTILVKNAKIGDNVSADGSGEPLMVIADMSRMKFTIDVDELDIWNVELGQTVVITANALPGETFSGEITNIAGQGEKKGDGVTAYAVEISVSEPGRLKSGMNVDAKIIINSAINVLTLPSNALYESDGSHALVVTDSSSLTEENMVNPADYPDIEVPEGYQLAKIQYGLSDGASVEILSGLRVGDSVLYNPDEAGDVLPAASPSPSGSGDADGSGGESAGGGEDTSGENVRSTGRSATGVTDL